MEISLPATRGTRTPMTGFSLRSVYPAALTLRHRRIVSACLCPVGFHKRMTKPPPFSAGFIEDTTNRFDFTEMKLRVADSFPVMAG